MNDILVTLVGNVASPVRYASTKKGNIPLASFRMAVTPRRFTRERGWHDLPTGWFTVICWRALADHVTSSVGVGDPVVVTGRMQQRPWEDPDTGRRGVELEVEAVAVGHDLSRGTTVFSRAERTAAVEEDDAEATRAAIAAQVRQHGERPPADDPVAPSVAA